MPEQSEGSDIARRFANRRPKGRNENLSFNMKRELIEIRHQWTCNLFGYQFYNPGCVLDGMTLSGIVLHLKKMGEQAFAKHVCFSSSEKSRR
jgi:hypothetical protein